MRTSYLVIVVRLERRTERHHLNRKQCNVNQCNCGGQSEKNSIFSSSIGGLKGLRCIDVPSNNLSLQFRHRTRERAVGPPHISEFSFHDCWDDVRCCQELKKFHYDLGQVIHYTNGFTKTSPHNSYFGYFHLRMKRKGTMSQWFRVKSCIGCINASYYNHSRGRWGGMGWDGVGWVVRIAVTKYVSILCSGTHRRIEDREEKVTRKIDSLK